MIFSLAIYSSASAQSQDSAYQFAHALLSQGHQLYRVFFYHDGVYQGSALPCPPQDETDHTARWQALAETHSVDLVICIAAGLRRGIIDQREAKRYEKTQYNLANGFTLSGLGQLVEAAVKSDRLITFGR
jgi:tRNA 2-thiouridine synthesizing protein D